jgi:hypothetical protein
MKHFESQKWPNNESFLVKPTLNVVLGRSQGSFCKKPKNTFAVLNNLWSDTAVEKLIVIILRVDSDKVNPITILIKILDVST